MSPRDPNEAATGTANTEAVKTPFALMTPALHGRNQLEGKEEGGEGAATFEVIARRTLIPRVLRIRSSAIFSSTSVGSYAPAVRSKANDGK